LGRVCWTEEDRRWKENDLLLSQKRDLNLKPTTKKLEQEIAEGKNCTVMLDWRFEFIILLMVSLNDCPSKRIVIWFCSLFKIWFSE
jgi:hypothetical protein